MDHPGVPGRWRKTPSIGLARAIAPISRMDLPFGLKNPTSEGEGVASGSCPRPPGGSPGSGHPPVRWIGSGLILRVFDV